MSKNFYIVGDDISDGYHTFDELYEHRCLLFIALCREVSNRHDEVAGEDVWRSRLHSDGGAFEGWFILGIAKGAGFQITYHLPLSLWGDTEFAETLPKAPDFDGHTTADVLKRLKAL